MAIVNIHSKRQRKARGEVNDVYQYDNIPHALRVQIIKIITDSVGFPSSNERCTSYRNEVGKVYAHIHEVLSREYDTFSLKEFAKSDFDALVDFFLKEKNAEKCLDFIEICFQILMSHVMRNHCEFKNITSQSPGDIVIGLNERFREHGVSYQSESEEIIRMNSQLVHTDVVKPTLILLSGEPLFKGINDEFLVTHEHYRHKRYKECLNDCLKPLESMMKAIHDKNNQKYSPNDTISKLINSYLSQNLVPAYLRSQLTSLKTMLETGIPTVRNKNTGREQGADIKEIPEELVSYMLHLTAANLLFLLKCEKNIKWWFI